MIPGSTVYGRVVSTDRSPVARAQLVCIPAYGRFLAPLDEPPAFRDERADEDGYFVIEDLPAGKFQILAQHEGYKIAAMGEPVYPDGYNDIYNVEVVLIPVEAGEYSVYGYVMDPDDRTIEGVRLALGGVGAAGLTAEERSAATDARGWYVFYGVNPGFYVLVCEKEGYAPKTVGNIRFDEPTDIVLDPVSVVRGRVLVRETNAPPESYRVRAIPASYGEGGAAGLLEQLDGMGGRWFNDKDGKFELRLPAGAYTLEARASGLTPGRKPVTLAMGEQLDGVTLYVSRRGGHIRGRVVTADGKSPAGAVVWIGREGGSLGSLLAMAADMQQRGVQVGDDGRVEFSNLAPDTYALFAKRQGYAQGRSGPVTVPEGRSVSGVEILLGFGGALQGYVTIDGALKVGAVVTIVGDGVADMTTTDRNGFYRIEGLAAGTYLASAASLEPAQAMALFAPLHASVEIYEGRTTVHNFGEEIGAAVVGYCDPAPPVGTFGFAVVRMPGAPGAMSGLNLRNPASWFTGDTTAGNFIVGVAQIGRDGYFRIDNVPEGTFIVDVLYLNLGEVLSGGGRAAYETTITVTGTEEIQLDISIPE